MAQRSKTTIGVLREENTSRRRRNLTPGEITGFVSMVRYNKDRITNELTGLKIEDADLETIRREILKNGSSQSFSRLLSKLKITPLGIPDLKKEIGRQFRNAVIRPGTTVGYTAAEACGGPIMQMSMNTFHAAGQLNEVTTGVTRIFELLEVRKNLKIPSNKIKFRDSTLTFDRIITEKRGDIVGATVGDMVKDFDVDSMEEIIMDDDQWWYSLFRQTVRNDFDREAGIKDPHYILRLTFHVDVLYSYKITLAKIAEMIEHDTPPSVICVYSPQHLGIIDVYPVENMIQGSLASGKINVNEDQRSLTFLSRIVVPNLDKVQIAGVAGIKVLTPSVSPIWQIVSDESRNSDGSWTLTLDPFRTARSGLSSKEIIKLCEAVGMTILEVKKSEYQPKYVPGQPLPSSFSSSSSFSSPFSSSFNAATNQGLEESVRVRLPEQSRELMVAEAKGEARKGKEKKMEALREEFRGQEIEKAILEARLQTIEQIVEQEEKEAERKVQMEELKVTPDKWVKEMIRREEETEKEYRDKGEPYQSDILKSAYLVMGETQGSNLQELLVRDDVEPAYTTSNDVNEIIKAFGVEAARNFLIQELLASLNMDGSYIQPRHIFLLADFITNQGLLVPINYGGISRQSVGALEKASFQRAMEVMRDAAAVGEQEQLKSISSAIYVGQKAPIGERFFDLYVTPEQRKKYHQNVVERPAYKLDPSQAEHSIDRITDLTFGTSPIAPPEARFDDLKFPGELPEYTEPIHAASILSGVPPPTNILPVQPKGVVSKLLRDATSKVQITPSLSPPSDSAQGGTVNITIKPLVFGLGVQQLPGQKPTGLTQVDVPFIPLPFASFTPIPLGLPTVIVSQMKKIIPTALTPLSSVPLVILSSMGAPSTGAPSTGLPPKVGLAPLGLPSKIGLPSTGLPPKVGREQALPAHLQPFGAPSKVKLPDITFKPFTPSISTVQAAPPVLPVSQASLSKLPEIVYSVPSSAPVGKKVEMSNLDDFFN